MTRQRQRRRTPPPSSSFHEHAFLASVVFSSNWRRCAGSCNVNTPPPGSRC
jgi:hypothetical protein